MNRSERAHDIVLFGATGFTGALVAEYLVRHHLGAARLALAGRDRSKLERVRDELARIDERARALPIVIADAHDRRALDEVAASTAVVCTTVGPYAKYGSELVAACVRHGTDYCDLTGEVQFMRRTIDAHHEEARKSGARIVHCCGFDSIPSDLGTWMMQEAMREQHGGRLDEVRFFAGETRGGFSGGTIASLLTALDEVAQDRSVARVLADPYALTPGFRGPDRRDATGVGFDRDLGMWTAPFVMASVNTRVVRRTNQLLDFEYGREFRYSEVSSTGKGPAGLARATAMTAGLGGLMAALAVRPTRKLLEKRVLPKPGEGPSKEQRERGFFVIRLIGKGRSKDGAEITLRGRIEGKADPGYGETAKMLGESALCLALDGIDAPGGVRTPASTMPAPLLTRLRNAGMVFRVE